MIEGHKGIILTGVLLLAGCGGGGGTSNAPASPPPSPPPPPPPPAPVIESPTEVTIAENSSPLLRLEARDPDGGTVSWRKAQPELAPPFEIIDGNLLTVQPGSVLDFDEPLPECPGAVCRVDVIATTSRGGERRVTLTVAVTDVPGDGIVTLRGTVPNRSWGASMATVDVFPTSADRREFLYLGLEQFGEPDVGVRGAALDISQLLGQSARVIKLDSPGEPSRTLITAEPLADYDPERGWILESRVASGSYLSDSLAAPFSAMFVSYPTRNAFEEEVGAILSPSYADYSVPIDLQQSTEGQRFLSTEGTSNPALTRVDFAADLDGDGLDELIDRKTEEGWKIFPGTAVEGSQEELFDNAAAVSFTFPAQGFGRLGSPQQVPGPNLLGAEGQDVFYLAERDLGPDNSNLIVGALDGAALLGGAAKVDDVDPAGQVQIELTDLGATVGTSLAAGDFDGDGLPDIAFALHEASFTVETSPGTFEGRVKDPDLDPDILDTVYFIPGAALQGLGEGLVVTTLEELGGRRLLIDSFPNYDQRYSGSLYDVRRVADVSGDGIDDLVVVVSGGAVVLASPLALLPEEDAVLSSLGLGSYVRLTGSYNGFVGRAALSSRGADANESGILIVEARGENIADAPEQAYISAVTMIPPNRIVPAFEYNATISTYDLDPTDLSD